MDDIKDRVLRVELEVEAIKNSYNLLHQDFTGLRQDVNNMAKTLTQIRWFALGMFVVYTGSQTGLLKFLMVV